MKTYNKDLINLSKKITSGNIQKSRETAERLTRPSSITHIGRAVGVTIGLGLLLGGLAGIVLGKVENRLLCRVTIIDISLISPSFDVLSIKGARANPFVSAASHNQIEKIGRLFFSSHML